MTHDIYRGVFPAMTTPFNEDMSIDFETLQENAVRLVEGGVDGLVPVGTTGESATLSHDEHIQVVEAVIEAVEDYDVPVIAGSGSNNTREALSLSRRSAEAGADGLLLISPYYNKPEPEGMEEHFRRVANEVDLPQIIYNVPSRTGRNIAVETAVNLASHENVVGYKAASGDLGRIGEVIERTRHENFSVLSGDDPLTVPMMSIGATGAISVTANAFPSHVSEMVHAALEEDYEAVRELHYDLGPVNRAMFMRTNPIPVNEAMEILGYASARMRSPLSRLSEEEREELRSVVEELE